MKKPAANKWTYERAGVPHLKGDARYNKKIAAWIGATAVPGVLGPRTGFAALFDLKKQGFRDPLLVSSTDGVGTKLELALLQGRHDTIGIDLVAMCVNDILTVGAKPVFFLDYFAAGKFQAPVVASVLKGVTAGLRQAGCALVGGETAIMPGFYTHAQNGTAQYDIAGFSVGLVERKKIVDGRHIRPGDRLIGLASTGFHSNGFSLLRKIFSAQELKGPLGRRLLTPTQIYVKPVLKLRDRVDLLGIVNITGGGFYDNLPRVLPKGTGALIFKNRWPAADIFKTVQKRGRIDTQEMYRTFNMGIGMVLVVRKSAAPKTIRLLAGSRLKAWDIGEVVRGEGVKLQ